MDTQLSETKKHEIISEINKRITSLKCPMCGNREFVIADGYFSNTIQTDLNNMVLGGQSVPSIGIICKHCGYISQHALGVLGLLNK